jgi:hypothetical protein
MNQVDGYENKYYFLKIRFPIIERLMMMMQHKGPLEKGPVIDYDHPCSGCQIPIAPVATVILEL